MPRTDDRLFHKYQLGAVIDAQTKAAFAAVDALPDHDILNPPKEDLVERFARQFQLELPVPAEDQRYVTNEEAEITVYDPWDQRHVRTRGYRATLFIPFKGDADLFLCHPSTFTLSPPRACVEPGGLEHHSRTPRPRSRCAQDFLRLRDFHDQAVAWFG